MSAAAPDTMALLNVYQPSRLLTSASCLAAPPCKGGRTSSAPGIIGLIQRHFADVPLSGRPRASFDDTKGLLLLRRCESERASEQEKPARRVGTSGIMSPCRHPFSLIQWTRMQLLTVIHRHGSPLAPLTW